MSRLLKWILEKLAIATGEIDVETNEQIEFNKFMMETSGGFHATSQDWTTVGRDSSGYPVVKGSLLDVTSNDKPAPSPDVEETEVVNHVHKWRRGVLPGQKYVKQCVCGKMDEVTFAEWQNLP